jgi:hypothetical protein
MLSVRKVQHREVKRTTDLESATPSVTSRGEIVTRSAVRSAIVKVAEPDETVNFASGVTDAWERPTRVTVTAR